MRSSACNKLFPLVVFFSIISIFVLLTFYSTENSTKTAKFMLIDKSNYEDYLSEDNSTAPERGTWRNLRPDQIDRLSTLGRILFLGETPPKTDPERNFTILIWKHGPRLERRHMKHYTNELHDPFEKCSVSNCKMTYLDEDVPQADAIIFHLQLTRGLGSLPNGPRNINQRWIFLTDESPYHTFLYHTSLPDYDGIFNWSMNFRMDADVPVPYGRTVTSGEDVEVDLVYDMRKSVKRNDVLVAIMASNCSPKNHRMNYVHELQAAISVDVYGSCGTLKCKGHYDESCPLIANYKFYLSFENSNCPQYITEKLWWNAYAYNSIPIVMGASREECKQLLPPDSYIHVDDYANPADLARYITYVNNSAEEYERFFKWRRNFKVLNEHGYFKTDSFHYCRVCEALNYNNHSKKVYSDLASFWNRNQCRKNWDEDRLQLN